MRSKQLCIVLAILAMGMSMCSIAAAQEGTPEQQKAMEMYMKLMATNENHAFLKNFVGGWNFTSTAWMQPGAPPAVSTGTASGELVLGGRFLVMKYAGTMFGQPFEGIQIIGFDNHQRKFTTFWIDNTSTSFFLTAGLRDTTTNTVHDTGEWPDPTGGTSKVRAVTRLVGPDEFTYELYMVGPDGKEFKSLENRATRKK